MRPSADSKTTSRTHVLRRRLVALGLAAAGAVALTSLLTVEQGCADKAPPPSVQPPILIGVSFGLTKGLSAFAKPLRDAIRVAEGQINASGGLLGRPVTFDVQDDQSDEDAIVARVASDFVARGAVAVIGPIGSQQVVKTQAIYAKGNVIQISPSATSTDLTTIQPSGDRWLYRTTPADDFQGAAVLLFAQRTPRGLGDGGTPPAADGGPPSTCSKLAIVHIDNAYGKSMADVIEKNFPKRSGQPILTRKVVPVSLVGTYADVVGAILPLQPECLALIAYDDVAAQFVRELVTDARYAALKSKGFFIIGTDGVYTDGFLLAGRENAADPTSPNTSEGIYGTNPDTQPGTKEYNEFRSLYASYFPLGKEADGTLKDAPAFAANTFDAAILIALAIQKAGTITDRNAVRRELVNVATPPGRPYSPAQIADALLAVRGGDDIDYKGASGAVDLEPNGNVKSGFIAWQAYRDTTKKLDYRTVGRFTLEELLVQLQ
jgi:ABC-type branched-subunit amino acid transport system substrate-binding protein